MKRFFHSELDEFRFQLTLMGERTVEIVRLASEALAEMDLDLADQILAKDDDIDALEVRLDLEGIRYLSLRAPVATELRLVTTGMRAAQELERVGDETCTIAKRIKRIGTRPLVTPLFHAQEMLEWSRRMLRDAINCLVDEDVGTARAIPPRDRQVDAWHKENYQLLVKRVRELEGADEVESAFDVLFISKAVERIADHATNLAEEAIFLYSGEDPRHSAGLKDSGSARELPSRS
jgi:phosphate transport system protein